MGRAWRGQGGVPHLGTRSGPETGSLHIIPTMSHSQQHPEEDSAPPSAGVPHVACPRLSLIMFYVLREAMAGVSHICTVDRRDCPCRDSSPRRHSVPSPMGALYLVNFRAESPADAEGRGVQEAAVHGSLSFPPPPSLKSRNIYILKMALSCISTEQTSVRIQAPDRPLN